jgi:hypothetical protein
MCFYVDTLIHLAIVVVFDGDLRDSLKITNKQSAYLSRPALPRNVNQVLDTLICLEIDIVSDTKGKLS